MNPKKALRLEADALARKCADLQWLGTCAVCGRTGTEVHHLISRATMATRYEPENLMLLCAGCHQHSSELSAHRTPARFREWLMLKHCDTLVWVDEHKHDTVTATIPWYQEQIKRLKATLARLERT